ncbi:DNA topoisomerase 4 subunit A [Marinicauda pacifica]|uniref:DNA topoisomerase 4 subunit A n=1 Tax=Marinicauda pacifica TaxID=1133559 RepID=A0A4V3RZK4_9PROT|nr:DNA topoisomerase IV subunit A [Marinicauda pacifica]TGY94599.1 DNA topoisomerase IV subunit A [Marinicauda pacifica]GGE37200.1 DNA topoisomerase 4 subunit A [Marinicauda pacifica]
MGEHFTEEGGRIFDESFEQALSSRYLAYALSTITQRALPDARDGLKPVHRRLMHAMRLLKLDPDSGFKKCARVVGDVIGKYHPHGDQSVYDALVRLAQDFAARYPLVEGQGNFGNIDGDGAAAMRYTEARLTEAARLLLQDIDAGTVDFRDTYDGEDEEPLVLPGAFPNLLANGAAGIAVGMATNIPPHNAAELCDAARHLIKTPNARTETLLNYIQGPDFPTGGVCVEDKASMLEAYETGRGGFRVRARWTTEDLGRGTWQIVITEIPYQVQKSRLVERIASLMDAKKLPLVGDVMDESAEDIRLVIEPKSRTVDPELLMESLFRVTDLEVRFAMNMNVLDPKGAPRVMGLIEVLQIWLDHRREVVVRRARTRLGKVEDRLEVLGGYIVAFLNLDRVIEIIRESDEPKPALMAEFSLNERQAEAILNMRLRSLRKLEEMEIRSEQEKLEGERAELNALLDSEETQWAKVDSEIAQVKKTFGQNTEIGRRRTSFADAPDADIASAVEEALISREPVTVVLSTMGWIRALKGHQDDLSGLKHKEGDETLFAVKAETTDKLILVETNGRFYTLDVSKLPGGRGFGEPLRLTIEMDEDASPIALFKHDPARTLLVASSSGHGFQIKEEAVTASKRGGKQILNVLEGAEAMSVIEADGDRVAVLGTNGKLLVFALSEIPEMARGKGVRLFGGKGGDIADITVFKGEDGLFRVDSAGRRHEVEGWHLFEAKRAQAGRMAPKGFGKAKRFDASASKAVANRNGAD